ncbi:AAA family ATPase [Streptomyces pathocidini]|uniref:Nuclease SbcCD subunit C n=3 Tax=Streptomyces pathocidini TaxID=1650571 RepID=A0ABW7UWU7_9ACTN
MRLHRLRITAFGPFGATQEVDFDELSSAGLFLLHGPTGAGKTSVLDAVCYALYGGVPGARHGGQSLRSDHAEPFTPTEIVLEFTVGERRLEVTRRPEQPRPKKRGDGLTREKAQTWLREWTAQAAPGATTGSWKALSRSHQEVGEEIGQLLGMNREQFCQVVLLPQGDFARFLRADAEARAHLLGRLFDTRRFAAVEEKLAELRRAAERRVRGGDERLLALAHRMAQAAGRVADHRDHPLPELSPGEPGLADTVLEWAALARTTAREHLDIAGTAVGAAEGDHGRAQRHADASRELAALQRRHAEARRRAADLEERRSDNDRVRARLDRGRAAESVVPALDLRHAADDAHRMSTATLRATRETLARAWSNTEPPAPPGAANRHAVDGDWPGRSGGEPTAVGQRAESGAVGPRSGAGAAGAGGVGHDGAPSAGESADTGREDTRGAAGTVDTRGATGGAAIGGGVALTAAELAEARADRLVGLERELRQELGGLAAARRAEERVGRIGGERAELEREAAVDGEALHEVAAWLERWESERAGRVRRVEDAREAARRAERLDGQLDSVRRRLDAGRRRDRLTAQVAEAEARLLRARERATAAHEHRLDLKERRLRGIAAELAAGLREGHPCAVCGATEHPLPAREQAGHVDRAAEEAARQDHERAERARAEAERAAQTLRESLAGAAAAAGEETTAELAAQADAVERSHREARRAAADLQPATEALARAEEEYERRHSQRQAAERRAVARTSAREALDREQAALEREVAQARGGAGSVAARAALLERRAGALAEAADAVRAAESAAQRLKEADARLADAAYRARFDTPQEAADAVLAEPLRRELQRRLDQWQAETAAAAAELVNPRIVEAANRPPAGTAAAQAAVESATRRLREASAAEAEARTRCAELDRLSARATADARELAPLREQYDRVARLAGLAAGTSAENERRMRLESYVLAARLEQVAAAASTRLHRMSAGRYTLVHSDAKGGRGRSGLGLHVIDAWTGSERDTASLSGGETFFASLALALGLADVVTEEAGGTRLDTLFIDEGFGSLDEQTLDEVLDVLDSLRERDRTVGIVSHVADLRQRIPAQLEVTKHRTGSAVRHQALEAGG